jgi:hypothetical protein
VGLIFVFAALLSVAGAADSVSAVCRSIINQSVTPEALRGRGLPDRGAVPGAGGL